MEATTKFKVSELEGAELNYWVARAIGYDPAAVWNLGTHVVVGTHPSGANYAPSTDWVFAGPIIERERISIYWDFEKRPLCTASIDRSSAADGGGYQGEIDGPTPLIAAMRCFVASKFGDEVGE